MRDILLVRIFIATVIFINFPYGFSLDSATKTDGESVFISAEAKPHWARVLGGVKNNFLSLFGLSKKISSPINSPSNIQVSQLPGDIQNLLEKSIIDVQRGDIDVAISGLIAVLDYEPLHEEANAILGACFLTKNLPNMAEGFLYTAVRLSNWTDPTTVGNLAECLRLNNDLDLAIDVAMRGLSQYENNVDPTGMLGYILGNIFMQKKDFSRASDWFLSAALQQPTNIDAWLKASTVLFPDPDTKMAENVLVEAIRYNPTSYEVLFQMGLLMHKTGRIAAAIPFYAEALHLNEGISDGAATMATALHELGRADEALEAYAAAEKSSPNNVILLSNYAILLKQIGRREDSEEMVTRATAIEPNHPDVLRAASF